MSYVQLTSPLILHADPTLAEHAVTKRYVDNKRNSVDASSFVSGILPVSFAPALTGDVTSAAGSGTAVLSATGVSPATYSKVTVSSSGRVTNGTTLVSGDIPSVSWSKVTSGRPTTAGGYGITNLIPLSGGGSSGAVSSLASPSGALSAVTKDYVDTAAANVTASTLNTGDVVRKPVSVTPTGFLRCNGGSVSKTTYSGLYSVLGDSFSDPTNQPGAGQPWRQQYAINTTQSGDITGWTAGTILPDDTYHAQAIVTKNRVYLLGGTGMFGDLNSVYTAVIAANGTLGTWSVSTSLISPISLSQAIVTKNRVYLLGGSVDNASSSNVYTAPINTDGTLGAWATSASLPGLIMLAQAVVTSNRVYLLGGEVNGSYYSITYTAPINVDGTLGTWTEEIGLPDVDVESATPAMAYGSCSVVTKNRVYLLGGGGSSFVYTAPINTDGTIGTWVLGSPLPEVIGFSQVVSTKNRVYLLGGQTVIGPSSSVYSAPINLDGTLGAWVTGTSLPIDMFGSQAVITSGRVHLLGGWFSKIVYTTSISGGLNDYSPYYDGTIVANTVTQTNFKLPDFSTAEASGINYYIKY